MRKTPSKLIAEHHPTVDDPSPLDACGWCLGWIAEARERGEVVPPRTCSEGGRLEAEALLKDHCAWCLAPIADEAPIETVSASMSGTFDAAPGVIGISIAGRRIHAVVPPAGFPLAEGHDVLFVLCGPECAAALADAVDAERTLRRIH